MGNPMKTILYYFSKNVQKKAEPYYDSQNTAVADDIEAQLDVAYSGGSHNPLFLDIYRAKKYAGIRLPVILMVHGGGLYVGSRKLTSAICQELARRGFLVFNLEYRLLTEADACQEIADICAGFRQAEALLPHYNGDRNRVYAVAESAGAYLTLYTAAMHNSERIREKIGCPVSGLQIRRMAFFSGMFYTKKADLIGVAYPLQIYGKKCLDREFMRYMNPEDPEVMRGLPPMLLVSSDADFLKKYTLKYADALKKSGQSCRLLYYTGKKELTHAFPAYRLDLKESLEVIDEAAYKFFAV